MDELRADQGTSLRLGTSMLRTAHTWALFGTLLGLPVIAAVALIHAIASRAGAAPICPAIWTAIQNALVGNPVNRLMLWLGPALLAIGLAVFVIERRARLRITAAGLEADIPRWLGLGLFRQTAGHWSVRWKDVRRVRLVCAKGAPNAVQRLASYRLVIETQHGETWLAAFRWVDRGREDHRLRLRDVLAPRKLDTGVRLESAPLVRAIRTRGMPIDADAAAPAPATGFDLARHKGLLAQVCLFFGAGLYALIDAFFMQPYLPLGPVPLWPFAVLGAIVAFAAWKLGQGAPGLERAAIGVITVAACVCATHPAMLRLNAATAEAETLTYISRGEGRFESTGDLPAITFPALDIAEYWEEYPPGSRHEFTLLRGVAGFYQLDRRAFHEHTRQFYRDRR